MSVTTVYTDNTEYSRYHAHLSVISVTIGVSSPVAGDVITASLFRLDGYGSVCTKQVTLTSATSYTVTFDLNKDGYVQVTDGGAISNPSIYMAKQGDYVVQTTDPNGNVVQSEMFAISIVPVEEMTDQWMKGVTLLSFERLMPRIQPQNITGATVTEVSTNHYEGPFTLSYSPSNGNIPANLSWDSGSSVNINSQGVIELLLMNSTQDYIMVSVNTLQLPSVATQDVLYIERERMKPRAFIDQIRRATADIEQAIVTKVEPTIIDTDVGALGHDFADEVGIAETYYRPRTYNKWMSLQLPTPNLLDLQLTGYFNQSKTAFVPREWLVWDERSAMIELVPSTSSEILWSFYNGVFIMQYLFNTPSIPSFWHFRATCGLRDLNGNRAIVREAIAKKAAAEILNSAGSAYRAGFASQSVSRDGVSQSEGYTSSSLAGTYGAHFNNYTKWLDENLPKMRTRFSGLQFRTI